METLKPPEKLLLNTGNIANNWQKFHLRLKWYLKAIDADEASDKRKVAILITVAGSEAHELFRTFTFEGGKSEDVFKDVVDMFEAFCVPKKNEVYERFVFRTREQKDGEPIEQFLTDLRLKAQSCNYGDLADSFIRDQIVVGIRDVKLKERTEQI